MKRRNFIVKVVRLFTIIVGTKIICQHRLLKTLSGDIGILDSTQSALDFSGKPLLYFTVVFATSGEQL